MLTSIAAFVACIVSDAGASPPPAWAAPLKSTPAPQRQAPFQLKPHPEINGFVYESAAFGALVFPDGSVDFRRGKSSAGAGMPFRVLPFPLNYKPEALPPGTPSLAGEVGKLFGTARASDPKPQRSEEVQAGAPYLFADTRSLCEDPKARCFVDMRGSVSLVTADGPLDATDELMRMLGEDPARYEKSRFLAATAPFRMKLAEQTRKRELREALEQLPHLLNSIWRTPNLTRAERLRLVAALREDVDVTTPGGEAALARIDDFMKKHVDHVRPPGGSR